MLTGAAPNIFSSDIIPEQQAAIDRYTRELVDNLERVALAALSNRAPSKLSWSEGTVKFAKNRRVIRDGRAQFGENDTAPVDHTLATMFVHGSDGKFARVLANYACHCTTLGGEWNQIHGDWSGFAQAAIERDYPDAVALISIGCGADANPSPRGKLENAQAHGNEIATEVRRLLALIKPPRELVAIHAAHQIARGKVETLLASISIHCQRARSGKSAPRSPASLAITRKRISRGWIAARNCRPNCLTQSRRGCSATNSLWSFSPAK